MAASDRNGTSGSRCSSGAPGTGPTATSSNQQTTSSTTPAPPSSSTAASSTAPTWYVISSSATIDCPTHSTHSSLFLSPPLLLLPSSPPLLSAASFAPSPPCGTSRWAEGMGAKRAAGAHAHTTHLWCHTLSGAATAPRPSGRAFFGRASALVGGQRRGGRGSRGEERGSRGKRELEKLAAGGFFHPLHHHTFPPSSPPLPSLAALSRVRTAAAHGGPARANLVPSPRLLCPAAHLPE